MSMTDPVADMLTRIRNAQHAHKKTVSMPSSKMKKAIAEVLKMEGYIDSYTVSEDKKPVLTLQLRYYHGKPVIDRLERISRPGLRVYKKCDELPKVLNGLGVAIISTSNGVMSDRAARAANQGGEVVCIVA